jgi:hemerythrin superfamily protein
MGERNASPGAVAEEDVVALLMRQHDEIRDLLDAVETTAGDDRREAFRRLVRLLAVHETAEEEVVHPYARGAVEDGEEIVGLRLEEERRVKEALLRLERMDCAGPGQADFLREFAALREEVEQHVRAEERHEFPRLEAGSDPERRRAMARAVRAAEAVAPTRPHPGVESGAENMAVGPFAAVVDRARDAIRGEGR